MRLALHARVLVDRHECECTVAASGRVDGTDARGAHRPARAARARRTRRISGTRRATRGPGASSASCSRRRARQWSATSSRRRWRRERHGTEIPFVTISHEEGVRRLDAVPRAGPGAPHPSRSAGHGSHPAAWGTGVERRGQVPPAASMPSTCWGCRRVEWKTDAANERSLRRARGAWRDLRGRPPQAHARPRRREPRQRLVLRHGRRLADRRGSSRGAPCREVAARGTLRVPGIPKWNWSQRHDRQHRDRRRARARRLDTERAARRAWSRPRLGSRPTSSCCACPTARSQRWPPTSRSGRGSRTSAARRHSTPSTRTCAASPSTRCSRSRRSGGRSSWTVSGARCRPSRTTHARSAAGWPRRSACTRSTSTTRSAPRTTRVRRSTSNYLVTLRAAGQSLLEAAGAPPEALDPLIRGVLDTDFQLTGPIARGDWETVDRHLAVIRAERPELEEVYLVLAEATARLAGRELPSGAAPMKTVRTITEIRRELATAARRDGRARPHDGRAARWPSGAPPCCARRERDRRAEPVREPRQFADGGDLDRYPIDESRDLELARDAGVDLVFAPSRDEMYPPGFQTWVDVTELGAILEGRFRPGHFRGVATVVRSCSPCLAPRAPTSARRTPSRSR